MSSRCSPGRAARTRCSSSAPSASTGTSTWPIGGFAGSEVYPKGALLRAARLRAEEKYRASFAERATIYVADSPRDVEAAKIGGATSIAVASGRASSAELRDAGADVVLRDLTDPVALMSPHYRHRFLTSC